MNFCDNIDIMVQMTKGPLSLHWLAICTVMIAMNTARADTWKRVQLEGIIKGAGCTHYNVECKNDDNHIALEKDFVLVMPDGEYYFMPNVYYSVKVRHAYRLVRVHGERRRQEIWVDKLVDLSSGHSRKRNPRAKSTWDWADDDFWRSK
jgi:hypothetical protein